MMPHKDYFEGILQLRNIEKEALNFAVSQINNKENASIAKIKKVPNGFDIYLSPQKFLRSLGNKLQQRFNGQITVSKKLHTQNKLTSKRVYRINLLFRMPNLKKGQIIDYRGGKVKILSIHKKVLAKDLKTGKKLNLNFKDLRRY